MNIQWSHKDDPRSYSTEQLSDYPKKTLLELFEEDYQKMTVALGPCGRAVITMRAFNTPTHNVIIVLRESEDTLPPTSSSVLVFEDYCPPRRALLSKIIEDFNSQNYEQNLLGLPENLALPLTGKTRLRIFDVKPLYFFTDYEV